MKSLIMMIFVILNAVVALITAQEQFHYVHISLLVGKTCTSSHVIFTHNWIGEITCSAICSGNHFCRGVFYSNNTKSCVGCDHFYTGLQLLDNGQEDTKYFHKCAVTDNWRLFNGSYYKLFQINTNHSEAKATCRELCSSLVHVNSMIEVEFIKEMASEVNVTGVYIGLEYKAVESEYAWRWGDDDTEMDVKDWGSNEPTSAGVENCVIAIIDLQYKWADVTCNSTYDSFICEKNML